MKYLVAGLLALLLLICLPTYLIVNYNYRWNSQCAAKGGVRMYTPGQAKVCVLQPVQLVTIAAKPW